MTIAYRLGNRLYLNLTNRCTNDCKFCLRRGKSGVAGYQLWLEREPDFAEVIQAMGDLKDYTEVVFVGFGEPLIRIELVKQIASWIKDYGKPVRVDTNGQANLIHRRNILPELEGLIDVISISLNATSAEEYDQLCQSVYGEAAYPALLNFAKEAKKYIPRVILSIVDDGQIDIKKAQQITDDLGVELRVRDYIE